MTAVPQTTSIFRVDKFIVPEAARDAFVERLRTIQTLLDNLEGCLQNLVLEQVSGPGTFNFVTIVEWASQEAMENARAIAAAEYARTSFNPQAFMQELGITADMGNYGGIRSAAG
ncbi:antibiotic biosynthesis monooxygenase family protein [Roseibium aggregatum]|uniref:Antibiotic biosynthesis monooxygenase n=1 Tax=Roseibium aggregatum TaxID=187304 RepID=A0A926S5K5_9HYPH|nr:antibiotic biosynthesis monooxygenase family protein [Roseibium aggregatum]MBD1546576.1 antibiotic biosynthesis monooxygenase [Roseibium aggregatum]